ncbi:MAG: hypothetical protein ABW046_15885 [Actinoplanes sp.]
MIPIGDPFDPGEFHHSPGADDGHETDEPGQSTSIPARPACRPLLTAPRGEDRSR